MYTNTKNENRTKNKKKRLRASESALFMLDYKSYTSGELRVKLAAKGYVEEEIDEAIEFLVDSKVLDDLAYTKAYINSSLAKGRGLRRIRYELRTKGITDAEFDQQMEETDIFGSYVERGVATCMKLLRGAGASAEELNNYEFKGKIYAKMNRKLAYLGYEYDIIGGIIAEALKRYGAECEEIDV